MIEKSDGYLIGFDEHEYISNVIQSIRDNDIASKISIERAVAEDAFTHNLVKFMLEAQRLNMVNVFFTDMLRNIFGHDNFFEIKEASYDIVWYVESFVENMNTVLKGLGYKTFDVRKKYTGKREIVFNEYKMRSIIMHLVEISLQKTLPHKGGVIYISDDEDKSFRLSVVSDNPFDGNKTIDEIDFTAPSRASYEVSEILLREIGGFAVLKRFASSMEGELVKSSYRGSTRYSVIAPKKFSNRNLSDGVNNIQHSKLEIKQFFETLKIIEEMTDKREK